MKDAGAIILAFGFILCVTGFAGKLRIGKISGTAGPVMIVVGALMMFVKYVLY
jgi:hypothetical protein